MVTQLLGATNDNVFRWLVIGIGKRHLPDNVGLVLMAGTACFVLPFLLLAAPAGFLADRFSKRSVIVSCKMAEIVIMGLGVLAIFAGSLPLLVLVVGLMGAQSALFGPAKLGSLPEMLSVKRLSAANGLLGLSTVVATVAGMAAGNWLADTTDYGQAKLWLPAAVLLGLGGVGWATSLFIARLPVANPSRTFPWNAAAQTWRDLKDLASNLPLFRVALGTVFFWSLGSLAQMNIDQFAGEAGALRETDKVPLLVALVFGLGAGSVLAGIASGGRVELGLLPLGAAGIALGSMGLFFVRGSIIDPVSFWTPGYMWACALLVVLGGSAGLFEVPLSAYIQHRSPHEKRGAVLASTNFLAFSGILLMAGIYALLRLPLGEGKEPLFNARQIFFLAGLLSIPVCVYVVWLVPQAFIRFVLWVLTRTFYRIRVEGEENLPEEGGALLISNHISWLDGVLLLLLTERPVRFVAWSGNAQGKFMRWLAEKFQAILLDANPKGIAMALKTARQALANGELICVFPEGGISRSGQLQGFKPGMLKMLKGNDAPVIPIYLDQLWGSIFSFERGKFFWKWPRRIPYPVSIHIGRPLAQPVELFTAREAVQKLGATAMETRKGREMLITSEVLRHCKRRRFAPKVSDSTGAALTGGSVLMRTAILRRLLARAGAGANEKHVGLLLPPSAGGVLANLAVTFMGKVAVNLNYTVPSDTLNYCIELAGIKHVVTSRKFISKMNFDLNAEIIYLEDFKDKVTTGDKIAGVTAAYVTPAAVLERQWGLTKARPEDAMSLLFTSGSTGRPKGVMLTYANIAHNASAVDQAIHLNKADTLLGILPFFHSMGYTITLWTVMALDAQAVYHFNPLDRIPPQLCEKYKCTLLLSTPTFLRSYLRRAEPEQMASLNVVVCGAEKLPKELSDAFEEKFGVRPVEGYGVTEMSPLVSVNIPKSRAAGAFQEVSREGSVGRPVAGVAAEVRDLETGEVLPPGQEGMLWVKGANRMLGYLNQPEKTAEVIVDEWYKTGDVAKIDDDGFIHITGRISRFSKIGGEMVPHGVVEEALNEVIGADEESGLKAAITGLPDEKKGERLVVVHTKLDKSPEELRKALQESELPNLFIPAADNFVLVDEIPVLGTGKFDLKKINDLAKEKLGG